jgi:hypothetical protein
VLGAAAVALVLLASGCVLKGTWDDTSGFVPVDGAAPEMLDVSCPDVDVCVALGVAGPDLVVQSWDGDTWSEVPIAVDPGGFWDGWDERWAQISCWSATGCMIEVGHRFDASIWPSFFVWDGTSWTSAAGGFSGFEELRWELECQAVNSCVALSVHAGDAVTWDGSTWDSAAPTTYDAAVDAASSLPNETVAVTCPEADVCHTLSWDGAHLYRWDGLAWSEQTLLHPEGQVLDLRSIDCASATACVATGFRRVDGAPAEAVAVGWWGDDAWGRIDPPSSWTDTPPTPGAGLPRVDCATGARHCMVIATGTTSGGQVASVYDWS